jgi:hypothetical protein
MSPDEAGSDMDAAAQIKWRRIDQCTRRAPFLLAGAYSPDRRNGHGDGN